tara:strand:- start:4107 stop:4250 length:144 start_codon:yes stop_codon:yes gene_type:complete
MNLLLIYIYKYNQKIIGCVALPAFNIQIEKNSAMYDKGQKNRPLVIS